MNMTITEEFKAKLISILDKGIVTGLGTSEPGSFCVEAAVCYALGEPHGDSPSCVAAPDRLLMIRLNDAYPGTPTERAVALRTLALAHLGTIGTDRTAWLKRVALDTIRTILPVALEAAASLHPDTGHQEALRAAASKCAQAQELASAARAAARARVYTAADAAHSASHAATAATYAAAASNAASYADAADAAAYAANAAYDAAAFSDANDADAADAAAAYAGARARFSARAAAYAADAAAHAASYAADAANAAHSANAAASAAHSAASAANAAANGKSVLDKFIAIVERAYAECPH